VVVTLSDAQLAALAALVAERLREAPDTAAAPQGGRVEPLVGADELAARLRVHRRSIYRHARALGGVRVGRAWRFDLERALAAWAEQEGDRLTSGRSQAAESPVDTGRNGPRRGRVKGRQCQLVPDLLPVGRVGER
jgi:hypothetical protein